MSDIDRDVLVALRLQCQSIERVLCCYSSADIIAYDQQAQGAIRFPVLFIGVAINTMLTTKFKAEHPETDWSSLGDKATKLAMKIPADTCDDLWEFAVTDVAALRGTIATLLKEIY